MNQYFVLLSGESTELGLAEIESLATLLDYHITIKQVGRFLFLTSAKDPTSFLLDRAALLKQTGSILAINHISDDSSVINLTDISQHIEPGQSFSLQSLSLMNNRMKNYRATLIQELGGKIKAITGSPVSLEKPDITFSVFLLDEKIIFCKSIQSKMNSILKNRNPAKKRFFHPSMMNAKLARIMCNLSGLKVNDTILDPFCGGAGILSEAMAIGAKGIGIDLDWALLKGAYTNLSNLYNKDFTLLQSDARLLSFDRYIIDAIVTDPPYGRTSSTRGAQSPSLIQETLSLASNILNKSGRLCISGSLEMNIPDIVKESGFKILRCNKIYVHSSLTREIVTATI